MRVTYSNFLWQQITLPILLWKEKFDLLYSTANFATFSSLSSNPLGAHPAVLLRALQNSHSSKKISVESPHVYTAFAPDQRLPENCHTYTIPDCEPPTRFFHAKTR